MLGCAGNGATLKELKVWAFSDFIRGLEVRPALYRSERLADGQLVPRSHSRL